ncbi:uncharacterized protein LOC121708113 [Alosa sapidissima]|uniref:uncharacterized protein LOC121708113 n=1 Tax=Alosa sapidissima TaxID=34773 RepID=UPI001C085278|nr:uncharacterized protein LOC121708113 [Alosa sapidissima]
MRKKRPPEQVSVLQAVRVSQAPEKLGEKDSGWPNRASGKGDTEGFRRRGPTGQVDAVHGCGDRRQPSQSGPRPGKVVLLRRGPTGSTVSSSSTTTTTTNKKVTPKKKVEWIPYTSAPSSPVLSSVWLYRHRRKCTEHREPSPAAPTDQLDNFSLNQPLLPMDMERPGAGKGSQVLGFRAASWTESKAAPEAWGQECQEPWVSRYPPSVGPREEAEAQAESPDQDGGCYYSAAPGSSGGMMPFRRKKSTNLRPSVSWADDDYWASWDDWNVVIDWGDNGPSKRRGRNRNREGKRSSNRWGNKGCQR